MIFCMQDLRIISCSIDRETQRNAIILRLTFYLQLRIVRVGDVLYHFLAHLLHTKALVSS